MAQAHQVQGGQNRRSNSDKARDTRILGNGLLTGRRSLSAVSHCRREYPRQRRTGSSGGLPQPSVRSWLTPATGDLMTLV